MRKNIRRVLDAFALKRAANDKTCRTDGTTVWSYALPIMTRLDDGTICVRQPWHTPTTNCQISACLQAYPDAVRVDAINPKVTP